MSGTETYVARSLQSEGATHGATLGVLATCLFAVLGCAGLLLDRVAAAASAPTPPEPAARVVHTIPSLRADSSWPSAPSEAAQAATTLQEERSSGTPWVLVAAGLAEFETTGRQLLLLEPDGSLRTQSDGALVGFLQGGGALQLGEYLAGPGQMDFQLLHHSAWITERAEVPIVERDGSGGWVVQGYRPFSIGVERERVRGLEGALGRPKLNERTGLPHIDLGS